VNIVLFTAKELQQVLPRSDPRAQHVLKVLKIREGQSFDAGLINGPKGKATITQVDNLGLKLDFSHTEFPPGLYSIDLWVSYCRPQTCRRILQECTSLGVRSLTFFDTEKCEPAYRNSRLWSGGEAERLLIRGAEQAFCTRIPMLTLNTDLESTLENHQHTGSCIALDNYEATERLTGGNSLKIPITIAVGGERGWSKQERDLFRSNGFILADLGPRVLRTDTACLSAVSIIRTQLID
jgi:16S rRNA (uracil1498-N3)-methyltransferase